MPASPASHAFPTAPRRGWLRRNWWLILLVLVLAVVIGGGVALRPYWILKHSEPFQQTVAELRKNPKVLAAIGEPADIPTLLHFPAGNVSQQDGRGEAGFTFPWAGPKGSGEVASQARMVDGKWGITRLVMQVNDGPNLNLTQDVLAQGVDVAPFDPNAQPKPSTEQPKPKEGDMNVKIEIPNMPPPQ